MRDSAGTLLLGMDGGGTKTECVLCAGDGTVLRVFRGPAANPNGQSAKQAAEAVRVCAEEILRGYTAEDLHVFAGIAGCTAPERRTQMTDDLRRCLPGARSVRVGGDIVCALSAAFGAERDGGIAIAGTGSACFARVNGEYLRTGGWGYLFGDAGSGYAIGRAVLMAAMRDHDGTEGGSPLLRALCEEMLGCALADGLTKLYDGGRTYIASFAACAAEALRRGDGLTAELVRSEAALLAGQIRSCAEKLPERRIALTGSIWRAFPLFRETVEHLCPDIRLFLCEDAASYGAVLEAAADAGFTADTAFTKRFREHYENMGGKQK